MQDLPTDPSDLDEARRKFAFGDERPAQLPVNITMELLNHLSSLIAMRSTNSQCTLQIPKNAMTSMYQQPQQRFHPGPFALQPPAPTLALPAPAPVLALPAPAAPLPGPSMPARAEIEPKATMVGQNKEAELMPLPAEPAPKAKMPMLALEDSPKKTLAVQDQKKDALMDVEEALDGEVEKAGHTVRKAGHEDAAPAFPKKHQPDPKAKCTVQESLLKLTNAISQRSQGKSSDQSSGMKRPASSKAAASPKKAAAAASSKKEAVIQKKPAGCGQKVETAKDGKSLKRPAASSSSPLYRGKISRSEAKRLKPDGCTSCRHVEGCTRSCWRKRKYEAAW